MWGRYYLASLYKHRKWGSEGWGESLNHRADQWQNQHSPCLQAPTDWKRLWCWERVRAGGEGDDRWWDGWMASPTQWTWVWANSGTWRRPGKSAVHGVAKSWTRPSDWNDWFLFLLLHCPFQSPVMDHSHLSLDERTQDLFHGSILELFLTYTHFLDDSIQLHGFSDHL